MDLKLQQQQKEDVKWDEKVFDVWRKLEVEEFIGLGEFSIS